MFENAFKAVLYKTILLYRKTGDLSLREITFIRQPLSCFKEGNYNKYTKTTGLFLVKTTKLPEQLRNCKKCVDKMPAKNYHLNMKPISKRIRKLCTEKCGKGGKE
ncbi:MAG: hypothetical protein NC541_14450 [bacterium]|nr:hypothetical protein [bacterium]